MSKNQGVIVDTHVRFFKSDVDYINELAMDGPNGLKAHLYRQALKEFIARLKIKNNVKEEA